MITVLILEILRSNILKKKGFRIYRGLSKNISNESFQTWGRDGIRFACVVIPNDGISVCQWYLSIEENLIPKEFKCSPYLLHGPFANNCYEININERQWICKYIKDLCIHEPILHLVESTNSIIVATDAIETNYDQYVQEKDRHEKNIVYLGDANFAFDPILSIGTSLAIEDAYRLVSHIQLHLHKYNDINIPKLVEDYQLDKNRQDIIYKYYQLNRYLDSISRIQSNNSRVFRDICFDIFPMFIKERVFDEFIRFSLKR